MIEARRRASHDKFSDRQSLPGLSLRYGLLRGAGPEKAGLPEDLFARQAPCLGAEEYFRFRSPDARTCLRRLAQYKPLIGALLCRVEETETALSVELVSARAGLELPEILVGNEFVFLVGLIRKATQEPVTPLSAAARQPVKDPAYAEFLGMPITQGGQDRLVSAGVFRVDGRVRQQKPSAGCLTALPFVGSVPSIRLLGGEAEPAGGFMDLDPAEAGLLQQPLQLGGGVDPHAGDLFVHASSPGASPLHSLQMRSVPPGRSTRRISRKLLAGPARNRPSQTP